MEPIQPLLAPARGGVDQQAARRADDNSASTIGSGRLNISLGVTSFLEVTGASEGRFIEAEAYPSAELLWFDLPILGAMARKNNERHRTTTLKP